MATQDINALVAQRVEYLEKKGRIALYPQNTLWEKILDNPAPGGGSGIQVPIMTGSPTTSVESNPLQTAGHNVVNFYEDLNFNYKYIPSDFPISEVAIKQIKANGGTAVSNYLDRAIMGGTAKVAQTVEVGVYQGSGLPGAFPGFKSIFVGDTYGQLSRDAVGTIADDPNGNGRAKVLGGVDHDGVNHTTKVDFNWADSAATAAERDEALLEKLQAQYLAVAQSGDEPDSIAVSRRVYGMLKRSISDKLGFGQQYGVAKSFTPSGKDSMTFEGAEVVYTPNVLDTDIFLLNTRYIMVPSVEGYSLNRVASKVVESSKYNHAKEVQLMVSGIIVTDAPTKHSWIEIDYTESV